MHVKNIYYNDLVGNVQRRENNWVHSYHTCGDIIKANILTENRST